MPHCEDLCKTIQLIASAATNRNCKALHPARNAHFFWHWLRSDRASRGSVVRRTYKPDDLIRKTHNFYGWKAESTAAQRGVCSGTLYRTAGYMQVPLDGREGEGAGRNIHIEHTVPVCTLLRALERRIDDFATACNLHDYLMQHSVCVGFSRAEELAMNGVIARDITPAFDNEGNKICERPFLRYTPFLERGLDFEVLNVVTGKAVDLTRFTFDEHVRTMESASQLAERHPAAADLYYASRFPAAVWSIA
jgi:hypothetical protein